MSPEISHQTLSILIPLYNEEEFVGELLNRVVRAPLPEGLSREIIVVDDCSTDGSAEVVEDFIASSPIPVQLLRHQVNRGKGASIRTAIRAATGEWSLIQDADLEYDPNEYPRLLRPLLEGKADVVYGSRFLASDERRVLYFWHSLANRALTTICNIVSDLNLTDMETCYKAFRTSLAKSIPIQSDRFGIDPELTVKFARRRARIYETSISYHGRTYDEGKKIGLRDAFEVLFVILRSRFTTKIYSDAGPSVLDALSVAGKFNAWMADTIRPFVGSRVLEIGAGIGNLTRQLCPRRSLYVASDIDKEHLELMRKKFQHRPAVQVCRLDAERSEDFVPFEGAMETVICLNVLEHLEHDANVLRRILTVLHPGGRLILLVPNSPAAFGTLDTALGHFRRYTREGLAALLVGAGYELEDMILFNRVSWPGWRFTGQVLKAKDLSNTGMWAFNKLVWLFRRIDGKLPWEPVSLIAIARRPGTLT
jgi:2-polyprenyl-3-methyl-5-hydroxy-6-metoxy-1,4-benzoquinol methylase